MREIFKYFPDLDKFFEALREARVIVLDYKKKIALGHFEDYDSFLDVQRMKWSCACLNDIYRTLPCKHIRLLAFLYSNWKKLPLAYYRVAKDLKLIVDRFVLRVWKGKIYGKLVPDLKLDVQS